MVQNFIFLICGKKSLWPTIGPAINNGFYYDADFGDHSLTEKDLIEIEKKFLEFSRQKFEFNWDAAVVEILIKGADS